MVQDSVSSFPVPGLSEERAQLLGQHDSDHICATCASSASFWMPMTSRTCSTPVKRSSTSIWTACAAAGRVRPLFTRHIATMKRFYQYFFAAGEVIQNPAASLVAEKTEKKLPQILTSKEVELLLEQPECTDAKGYRDRAMLELLYATGIRVTELISLNVSDVSLAVGVIRCRKKDKERVIPLYPKAVKALAEYMEFIRPQMIATPDEQSLFVNVNGERMTRQGFWKIVKHISGQGSHREGHNAAHAAPLLRCAPAGKRRRPALHPGDAGPFGPLQHTDICAYSQKAAQRRLQQGPSTGVRRGSPRQSNLPGAFFCPCRTALHTPAALARAPLSW